MGTQHKDKINPNFAIAKFARRADRLNPTCPRVLFCEAKQQKVGFNLARRGNPKKNSNAKFGIKVGILCSISFVVLSFLIFRTGLPKEPSIFLYNLIIIVSLQGLGFYRGIFFLVSSAVLIILLSLGVDFSYGWNVPMFFITFLIVDDQIKKNNYYTHIINTRIEEVRENTNILIDEYDRNRRDREALERKEERYRALRDVSSILSSTLLLDKVVGYILDSALKIVGKTGTALLFLVDTEKQELNLYASSSSCTIEEKKGDMLDEWVLKQRQCLIVEDIKRDFRFSEDKMKGSSLRFRSVILSPLMEERKVIGILRMEHSMPYKYTSEDLRLLDILSDMGAVGLKNTIFYNKTLELAMTDGLTGLYLRRFFMDRVKEELLGTLHSNSESSFLMVDIDNFKNYNDRFGHTAGDIVLKNISGVIQGFVKHSIVARYGGEEFAMLLPDTSKVDAKMIAEGIREAIKKEVIEIRKIKTNVTVSIGVASFPEDAKLYDELIMRADERLYMAKRKGKDMVV